MYENTNANVENEVPKSERGRSAGIISAITVLAQCGAVISAAVVFWTCDLLVAANGAVTSANFALISNLPKAIGCIVSAFTEIFRSDLSNAVAAIPTAAFWLTTSIAAVILPILAVACLLCTLFGGRSYPRAMAAVISLCCAQILAARFAGVLPSASSAPVICLFVGLGGMAVTIAARAADIRPRRASSAISGAALLIGAAIAFIFFPTTVAEGVTPVSALLAAMEKPDVLSVALSVATLLCSTIGIAALPFFIGKTALRCMRGYYSVTRHGAAFLLITLLTSGGMWAYAHFALHAAVDMAVYFYAAGGALCFVSALALGGERYEK